jgi:hypothetical protein
MTNPIQLKIQAHREWADYLEKGDKMRGLFLRAALPVPEELKQLLGGTSSPAQPGNAPFRPPFPPDAQGDWIWIDIPSATTTTLTLALVRQSAKALTAKEIRDQIVAFGGEHAEVVVGTVYNAVQRMIVNGVLDRSGDGTIIIKQMERVPMLYEHHIWGAVTAFQMTELAAHRRDAEVYILRKYGPLQQMQLLERIKEADLLNPGVPLNKDLIKGDFNFMNGTRIRKVGSAKKWEAI